MKTTAISVRVETKVLAKIASYFRDNNPTSLSTRSKMIADSLRIFAQSLDERELSRSFDSDEQAETFLDSAFSLSTNMADQFRVDMKELPKESPEFLEAVKKLNEIMGENNS